MRTVRYFLPLLIFLISSLKLFSQEKQSQSFSLKDAQDYAVLNSYKTRGASFDLEIAKKQVKNYTAIGLPQINASAKYSYFIDIPTQLLPDFITPAIAGVLMQYGLIPPGPVSANEDQKFAVQFGSKNNFTADATLSQLIFDGTYIVGLKTAKVYVEMTKTSQIKSQQEIRETVAQTYNLIVIAKENRNILDSSIMELQNMEKQILAYRRSGFRDTTDVEQITLLLSQMHNKLAMVDRQIDIATDLLKFQMGIDINEDIILTDNFNSLMNQAIAANLIDRNFDPKNHIDYKLLETSNLISKLQYKMDKFKYLPTLAGFGSMSYNAQRSNFDFFKSGSEYPWYKSSLLGLSLSVPIWSSGIRYYKVQMGKYTVKKNELILQQAEQGMLLEVQNAKSDFRTYADDYQSQIKNLDLAHRIYKRTYIAYREGVLSSIELTQTHNQYLTTQGNYFNSALQLLNANSKLNKALNNY